MSRISPERLDNLIFELQGIVQKLRAHRATLKEKQAEVRELERQILVLENCRRNNLRIVRNKLDSLFGDEDAAE